MSIIQTTQRFRRSRAFALLALLFVFGLQSLEVTHSHVQDDGVVECLACKSSSAGAVSVAPPPTIDGFGAHAPAFEYTLAAPEAVHRLYDSRGPPPIS